MAIKDQDNYLVTHINDWLSVSPEEPDLLELAYKIVDYKYRSLNQEKELSEETTCLINIIEGLLKQLDDELGALPDHNQENRYES